MNAAGTSEPSRVAAGLGPDVPERVVTAPAPGGGAGFAVAVGIGAALLIVAFAGVGLVLRRTGPVAVQR